MLEYLLDNNKKWAENRTKDDIDFFKRLSEQQAPKFLWLGCSDSRVPANEIVGLAPGEVFVHRNVANIANPTDINFLSVLAYAITVLGVEHIIICGHYNCGGVRAAIEHTRNGLFEHWLQPISKTYRNHKRDLETLKPDIEPLDKMCEWNVEDQVKSLYHNPIIQDAWGRGQNVSIHGWIYSVGDGLIHDLGLTIAK